MDLNNYFNFIGKELQYAKRITAFTYAKLQESDIANIKNYGDSVKTLDLIAGIRQVPGMYIGKLGNRGLLTMIREIYQNSMDERMRKNSICNMLWVTFDERNNETTIEDNGRGLPFDKMIAIYNQMHTSTNYDKKTGEYSSGLHGAGAKATNALSSSFIAESYILGEARRVVFDHGYTNGQEIIPNLGKQGTKVSFIPDTTILGDLSVTILDVITLIKLLIQLTDVGTTVHFKGIYKDGKEYNEEIINKDGILSGLILKTKKPLIKPIMVQEDTGIMKAEIIFTYDSDDLQAEDITAFTNYCPTSIGTHVTGFTDGVCRYFREYMNKVYLAGNKKNKLQITNADVKTGLKAVVTACHLHPTFTGQAKDELSNEDMHIFVRELCLRTLNEWSKVNPKDLEKICKYLKGVAEIRVKSEEGKNKLSNNYKTSALSKGLPAKYVPPNGTKNTELIIVEGDSAGGSAKLSRDNDTQGIYPIRGKLPNAMVTKLADLIGNEEVSGLIEILGCGYGRNFDINKFNFEYIIFTADKDPDGDHIATLLLKIVLVLFPQLIEAGKIYKALPPLFGMRGKNGKLSFFTDRYDYVLYTQKAFAKDNSVTFVNNVALTKKELAQIFYDKVDYTYELKKLAKKFALEPELVELYLINRDLPLKKLSKVITDQFRFIKNFNVVNNNLIIEGLIGNKYQTLIVNDKFLYEAKYVINIINTSTEMYYKMNNNVTSLYILMKTFESYTPTNLTRYKGLGEMNAEDLYESTLDKNTRTLIQYTMEDAKAEIEMIRAMESNKGKLLENVNVTRSDLL